MSNLPKCKLCGCVGIHACMGQVQVKPSRAEKRKFWREIGKAIKKIKAAKAADIPAVPDDARSQST